MGVAHPILSEDSESLVEIRDHALYDANRLGRNRTCARTHEDLVTLATKA
jgi:PleD family two-component response regulator